jgi:bifunctional non-homologous end joining protein LigD
MPIFLACAAPSTSAQIDHRRSQRRWVKYDGYRLSLQCDGECVRLITRGGWTGRYPRIVESALKNRHRQFVVDGQAVVLGVNDFNALHSRKHDHEVQLYH